MNSETRTFKKVLSTMSGMWAIWDYETYKNVDDYDKWEPLFCEDKDIQQQIEKNTFVPLYIFEDGTRSFTIKINGQIDDREQRYVLVKSEQYLLKTSGKIVVSGIENIEAELSGDTLAIDLEAGNYSVQIYFIAWDDEPNAFLENGEVNPDALSDFVIIISSDADDSQSYRTRINTFSEDDDCED